VGGVNSETARRINIAIGIAFGVGILLETMINAAAVAPDFGEAVPSWLQWATDITLTQSLWIDSMLSIVFIAWILFQIAERDTISARPRRMRRSRSGGAATGAILLILAIVLGGAFLYAMFGLNVGDIATSFEHFLGGL
jgi:hypothetical protein